VDRIGPKVTGLGARIRGGYVGLASAAGAAKVVMRWGVTDRHSRVKWAVLQRKIGRRPWRAIDGGLTSANVTLEPEQTNRFRVRSRDRLGNTRTSGSIEASLVVRDSDSSAWQVPGDWRQRRASGAQGGSLLVGRGSTARLRMTFLGSAMAIVAPVGPERGRLRVRIDGGTWQEVSLRRPRALQRRVVFTRRLGRATHLIEVQGLSGRTAVDALLFVR
jgi:hypothetical protein